MVSISHLTEAERTQLEHALRDYTSTDMENEDSLFGSLPERFQKNGCILERDDFIRVVQWKARRAIGYARANDVEKVQRVTREAFGLASEGLIVKSIIELKELKGVRTRMATALLTFYDPDQFTVMDWRAWRALVHLRVLDAFDCWFENDEDYPTYLRACKELAAWFGHSLRDTDRALWALRNSSNAPVAQDSETRTALTQ